MSMIHVGNGEYVQLIPPTVNEVWESMIWDEKTKQHVPDSNGVLMKTGTLPGLKPETHRYTGKFPSITVCTLINAMKEKMKFFDDGVRMTYGRPDRNVEVEPNDVKHPIPYPPAGYVVVDNQWVLKRSKYE